MAKVKLENVYKVYEGGVRAVNDFNLDIPDKEFVVFVGPSGCGKSTTLRMIAGLEDITQGKLYIDDEVVNDVESKNRDIAMVFQNYALYPHMTVFQNMAFGLKLRHTPKEEIEKRVKNAAEILEISELLTRKPKALSGGQRQRVALGRAIVREPKVFLLDEPLSNLDAKLRVQMRSEITKLHEKLKTTFIYVTHDQTEAMTMGTRIVVMKDGFIQQVDSPVALYNDPANLFVATFLGSPQMNILNARLGKDGAVLTATLTDAEAKPLLKFSNLKTKELVNSSYIGKDVKFGIRPENIKVDENGNIEGIIDVVEQLGDETIYYCQIPGIKGNVIVKAPFKGRVKTKEKIKLTFDMDAAYLFDKETTNSILGVRTCNSFKATFSDNEVTIGKNVIDLPADLKSKLLGTAFNKELQLVANVNEISLKEIPNSIKLPIKIEFTEDKTDYVAAFFKVNGLDEYFVMKLKLDQPAKVDYIYMPVKNMKIYDENHDLVKSHEIVYKNETSGHAFRKDGRLFVKACGTTLEVKDRPEFAHIEGECTVEISPENAVVILSKKLLKEKLASDPANAALLEARKDAKLANRIILKTEKALEKVDDVNKQALQEKLNEAQNDLSDAQERISKNTEYLANLREELFTPRPELKKNLITFTAYDEDKSSNKNFIYGVVKGIENYATFHVENNFSVYAMDKFKIHIPGDSIILK
ncbi:MAG: sn-glycerol-3-phosphate ABC transporter ATP-binding protein UgpC [Bacilli bacterium]|nr:sn-glycerol-3-phosphate ABC transporter ATP-binding protein UgpC [Bacilli bacterium]